MDAFALPVEGTETRVNAQSQAYEYMTAYIESATEVGMYTIFLIIIICEKYKDLVKQHCLFINLVRSFGKCHWLVSQSSRLRLLVVWHRCIDTNVESKLSRTICGHCG